MSNRHQELASLEANNFCKESASPKQMALALAIPEQTATGKEISNLFMAGEDCWVLEDFTTYCCWFNIGAASEDLVLLRKIEENRLSLYTYPEGSPYQPRIDASMGHNPTDSHLEGKPPRRDSNLRPLTCGNNLRKDTLGGQLMQFHSTS
ncbi:hypothetical protein Tco_1221443 [Tanacetum coccineum]